MRVANWNVGVPRLTEETVPPVKHQNRLILIGSWRWSALIFVSPAPPIPPPKCACYTNPDAQLPPALGASQSGQPPLPPPPLPPPLPSTGHAPPPPPLPPAAGGASVRGDLLASITDGKKLKKVERPAPEAGGGGGGGNELLDAIRNRYVICT